MPWIIKYLRIKIYHFIYLNRSHNHTVFGLNGLLLACYQMQKWHTIWTISWIALPGNLLQFLIRGKNLFESKLSLSSCSCLPVCKPETRNTAMTLYKMGKLSKAMSWQTVVLSCFAIIFTHSFLLIKNRCHMMHPALKYYLIKKEKEMIRSAYSLSSSHIGSLPL